VKYCPSPDCPDALRHEESREYRDEAVTCAECGAELAPEKPDRKPTRSRKPEMPWAGIALAIIVPLAVVWLGPKIRLPRLDIPHLGSALGSIAAQRLSVVALGLNPVLSASVLVELAALSVPRWRTLRTGGPAGRARLQSATAWLTLALALAQGLGLALYLERMGALLPDPQLSRLIVVFSLVAGTFFLVALARFLDAAAVGGGFSLLLTAFGLATQAPLAAELVGRFPGGDPGGAAAAACCALLLAALGTVWVLRSQRANGHGSLPLPASGLIPLQWSATVTALALLAAAFGIWPDTTRAIATGREPWAIGLGLALTAAAAVAFCLLFNRPSKVAAFGPDAVGRVKRAILPSTAYVVGIAILGGFVGRQLGLEAVSLVPLVAGVAVVLDAVAESAAIRRHGPLRSVWPEHRLYAVDSAQAALERAGIPSLARSIHQRVLWHFFAPLIPIQIMVPEGRADEAGRLLLEHFRLTGTTDPDGGDG
jgi:SecY